MKIVQFHMVVLPNGSMVNFGLGDDNKLYQYDHGTEEWTTLKNMAIRRKLTSKEDKAVGDIIRDV